MKRCKICWKEYLLPSYSVSTVDFDQVNICWESKTLIWNGLNPTRLGSRYPKNGRSKICGRQPLKYLKWHGLLLKIFKDCLPQTFLGPFLNTLTYFVIGGHTTSWRIRIRHYLAFLYFDKWFAAFAYVLNLRYGYVPL